MDLASSNCSATGSGGLTQIPSTDAYGLPYPVKGSRCFNNGHPNRLYCSGAVGTMRGRQHSRTNGGSSERDIIGSPSYGTTPTFSCGVLPSVTMAGRRSRIRDRR